MQEYKEYKEYKEFEEYEEKFTPGILRAESACRAVGRAKAEPGDIDAWVVYSYRIGINATPGNPGRI